MTDGDSECRLRGLLSEKKRTNQILRERRCETEAPPRDRAFAPPPEEDEDTHPNPRRAASSSD